MCLAAVVLHRVDPLLVHLHGVDIDVERAVLQDVADQGRQHLTKGRLRYNESLFNLADLFAVPR